MEFGVVGRVTEGFFRYQGWPTVAKDEKGVIYAGSSGHRLGHVCPFGKNYLYISRDNGDSWEGPIIVNDTVSDDRDAGLCAWGDGQLVLSWFNHKTDLYEERADRTPLLNEPLSMAARQTWKTLPEGVYQYGSFVRVSKDGGKTWGDKVQVPVTAPHGPIRRADGSLFYLGKEFHSKTGELEDSHIYAYESKDNGETWQYIGEVPLPEGFGAGFIHEPHAVELPDGTILGGLRVSADHFPLEGKNGIFTTFSYDGGKTFTNPQLLNISGTPPHFLLHSSGAIVLTYARRCGPCDERAIISRDGGKTWSEEIVISQPSPDWDLGYPSSVELPDGKILTVYYQKYPGDSYNSVLYTKWELPR